ncbi:TVP38/TMEM64 family protein [Roseimaritima ulvae]|uniref:TVP38/TMEM64 family membrane protein n=1 Tax=Roseimaritima ulvae TaxID=980254 RepID=A0A5B9QU08_9BACT|nr:VTT domain-containing protein [Roseimaritima ulvae]QEG40885.1 SNARE associated Golgi protein [Roseimaritima ulvae]
MRNRVILLLVLLALLALGWWKYADAVSWQTLADQEEQLRQTVRTNWGSSLVFGFLIYVLLSLVPGTAGKSIVYGWLFGFWLGLLIVSTALTIAAVISLIVVRYMFRDWVEAKLSRFIRIIDSAVASQGATWLVALRLMHAPYTITNYALGATDVRVKTFAWTTQLGMLPGTIVFVLAGASIPELHTLAEKGIWGVVDVPLMVLLSLLALLPLLGRWVRSRFRNARSVAEQRTNAANEPAEP